MILAIARLLRPSGALLGGAASSTLAALLFATASHAEEPPPAASDYRAFLDQARFFIKKQWYDDARRQLESAVAHPDGRIDPEAWYMLATVRFELLDLDGARQAAERAHSYARDDEQLEQAAALAAFLREQFGVLNVDAPYAGLGARLDIDLESVLFDPELKRYLGRVQEHFDEKVVLPVTFGLPAGTYRVNGRQVTLGPGEKVDLVLEPSELGTSGPTAAKLAQMELATGVSAFFGRDVSGLLPAPTLQVAVSQPFGHIVVGALAEWTPRPYRTADNKVVFDPLGMSAGARVGYRFDVRPLYLRISGGYRYGYLPGIARICEFDEDGDAVTCASGVSREMVVYAVGRAHAPFAEVSADFISNKRTTDLGIGVKLVVEEAFGTVPKGATARGPGDNDVPYTVSRGYRSFAATGLRALFNISLAF